MRKMIKYFLGIMLTASVLYAADDTKSASDQPATVKSQATTTAQQPASGTAKAKIITPAPKTNWSKIKDLFM